MKRLYIQNQIELHKMVFNLIISPRSSCIFMYENNETVAIFWSATEKYPSEGELFSHVNENSSDRFTFPIRTKNRRSRLTALTLVWFLWDVKEPTPLFEKCRGRRPQCCGQPSLITSFTSWVGWVQ